MICTIALCVSYGILSHSPLLACRAAELLIRFIKNSSNRDCVQGTCACFPRHCGSAHSKSTTCPACLISIVACHELETTAHFHTGVTLRRFHHKDPTLEDTCTVVTALSKLALPPYSSPDCGLAVGLNGLGLETSPTVSSGNCNKSESVAGVSTSEAAVMRTQWKHYAVNSKSAERKKILAASVRRMPKRCEWQVCFGCFLCCRHVACRGATV